MISMTEYKDGTALRTVTDPRLFEKKEKEQAYEQHLEYVCRCRPEKDLRYKFSKDFKLYPVKKGEIAGVHSDNCPFSDQYEKNISKKATVPRNKETGELSAAVVENIAIPLSKSYQAKNSQTSNKEEDPEPREADGRVRVVRLIKELNLEISQRQAQSFNKKVRNLYEFNRWLFVKAKEVPLEGRNMMLNDPDTGVRFIYEQMIDLCAFVKDGEEKEYRLSKADYDAKRFYESIKSGCYKCSLITGYKDKNGEYRTRTMYVSNPAMLSSLKEYIKPYGKDTDRIPLKLKDGHVIATGYDYDMEYKDKTGLTKHTRKIGRLWFITVSKRGIYARNNDEAQIHEAALSLMENNKDIRYYVQSIDSPYGLLSVDGHANTAIISLEEERRSAKAAGDISVVYNPEEEDIEGFKKRLDNAVETLRT